MVVRAVVQAHQGRFVLRSKVGRGTQALVELPLLADFSAAAELDVNPTRAAQGGYL